MRRGLPTLLPGPGNLTHLRQIAPRNGFELNRLIAAYFLRRGLPSCGLMAIVRMPHVVSNRHCRSSLRSRSAIII